MSGNLFPLIRKFFFSKWSKNSKTTPESPILKSELDSWVRTVREKSYLSKYTNLKSIRS